MLPQNASCWREFGSIFHAIHDVSMMKVPLDALRPLACSCFPCRSSRTTSIRCLSADTSLFEACRAQFTGLRRSNMLRLDLRYPCASMAEIHATVWPPVFGVTTSSTACKKEQVVKMTTGSQTYSMQGLTVNAFTFTTRTVG